MNFLLIIFLISIKRFRFFVFTFWIFLLFFHSCRIFLLLIFTFHSNAAFNQKSFLVSDPKSNKIVTDHWKFLFNFIVCETSRVESNVIELQ